MNLEEVKLFWEQKVCNYMKQSHKNLTDHELISLYKKQQEENIPSWIIKAPKSI